MVAAALAARGWVRFAPDPRVAAWAGAALDPARAALADPANAPWWQCEGTWFVGVDTLPNDAVGRVGAGPELDSPALDLWRGLGHAVPPLHRAQLSAIRPGYPRPRADEGEGAFRYRRDRDAAHVDGLLPVGEARRRKLREPHAFILGIPLAPAGPEAAPLVVWDGSHRIVARHLAPLFATAPEADWPDLDLTDAYHAARRDAFAHSPRIALPLGPGESVLLHHLCLHGMAPWADEAAPPGACRMTAYLRPEWPNGARDWGRSLLSIANS